jgi:hypothetical protein
MKGGTAKAICALSALLYLYGMPQTGIGCVFDTVKNHWTPLAPVELNSSGFDSALGFAVGTVS